MVHIEVTSWYPPKKNQEVTNKYLELMKDPGMPSAVKSFQIFAKATREGTQSKAYLEIGPGKMDEALAGIDPLMAAFAEIEGYRFEYSIALSLEEALANQ